ncbi:MAG: shikimate kinase [Ruminococcus sp.]|nr:shikimate kinase [Ruminococcus sp.]
MTIFLCGFMGCGKTTVGKLLAKKLGLPLIDTDAFLVEQEGKSIPEIFAENSEPYFREKEAAAIRTLRKKSAVISCGGGAMLRQDSAEAAKETGKVVLLDIPFEVCYERIQDDTNRPIVQQNTKEQLEAIFNERATIYRANASFSVSADGSPLEVAERIIKAVKA